MKAAQIQCNASHNKNPNLFTIFLVKQLLDLLSKDDFLPHAVYIVIVCQVEENQLMTGFQIKSEATAGKNPGML